jgi:hypothetical protein
MQSFNTEFDEILAFCYNNPTAFTLMVMVIEKHHPNLTRQQAISFAQHLADDLMERELIRKEGAEKFVATLNGEQRAEKILKDLNMHDFLKP